MYLPERAFEEDGFEGYTLAVPPGRYRVRLHFMELYHTGAGGRSQNVLVAGKPFLENFDPHTEAGGQLRPVVRETVIDLESSPLTIEFTANKDKAQVCGIEVMRE